MEGEGHTHPGLRGYRHRQISLRVLCSSLAPGARTRGAILVHAVVAVRHHRRVPIHPNSSRGRLKAGFPDRSPLVRPAAIREACLPRLPLRATPPMNQSYNVLRAGRRSHQVTHGILPRRLTTYPWRTLSTRMIRLPYRSLCSCKSATKSGIRRTRPLSSSCKCLCYSRDMSIDGLRLLQPYGLLVGQSEARCTLSACTRCVCGTNQNPHRRWRADSSRCPLMRGVVVECKGAIFGLGHGSVGASRWGRSNVRPSKIAPGVKTGSAQPTSLFLDVSDVLRQCKQALLA